MAPGLWRRVAPRRWPALLALGALALGLAGVTGSSYWAYGSNDPLLEAAARVRREWWGVARGIRSDEWAVDLPLARAQQAAVPSFPLVNPNLGLGHLQRHPFGAPVLDWGIAFRPHLWPLLLGNTWSHGVRWFARSALLLLGLFAWMRCLSDVRTAVAEERARRADVAAIGSLAIFFSSAMSWLLSHAEVEIVAFAGLAVFAAERACAAHGRARRVGWTLALFYVSACAFFNFYAPVWAPVLWLLCGAILDLAWRSERGRARGVVAALPLLGVVAAGVLLSLAYYAPYLALVSRTLYPGQRVASAGELPIARLVDMIWPALETAAPLRGASRYRGSMPLNECEAACVEALPLFLLGALATVSGPIRQAAVRVLRSAPWTAVACVVLGSWLFVHLPGWVGSATLLRWTPGNRAWIPFGLACSVLATSWIAELEAARGPLCRPARAVSVALLFFVLAWAFARTMVRVDRALVNTAILAASMGTAASALFATRWGARSLAIAWLLPLVVCDAAVNPLMPSGALFARGPGHAVVDAALKERPGRIVDFTGAPGATLAGFGWPVLASLQTAPDLALFRFLAPESPGLTESIYNRYAHVLFVLPPEPTRLLGADVFQAAISPCSPRLAALGVNHVLAPRAAAIPAGCEGTFDVRRAGDLQLWSRRRPVGSWGVAAAATPRGALEFDFSAGAASGAARVVPRRSGVRIEIPAGERRAVAYPVHLELVDRVRCEGARAGTVDAHVVIVATGDGGGRCDLEYLGTLGAIRRLLRPGDARPGG